MQTDAIVDPIAIPPQDAPETSPPLPADGAPPSFAAPVSGQTPPLPSELDAFKTLVQQNRPDYWIDVAYGAMRPMLAGDYEGAISAATTALERYIRDASDAPPDKYERGAAALCDYAFAPREGDKPPLTQHLSGSLAAGVANFMKGIFSFIRNPAHHGRGGPSNPFAAVLTLDTINYAFSLVRDLAAATYLDSYLSATEFRSLSRVRHLDIDGDGEKERLVTFTRNRPGTGETVGAVLVTKRDASGVWRVVPGRMETAHGNVAGEILDGLTTDQGRTVVVVRFARLVPEQGYLHEALLFDVAQSSLRRYDLPPDARYGDRPHEIRDHLQTGRPQLISYAGPERRYWMVTDGTVEPAANSEAWGP